MPDLTQASENDTEYAESTGGPGVRTYHKFIDKIMK